MLNTVSYSYRSLTFTIERGGHFICDWTAVLFWHPHHFWEGSGCEWKSRQTWSICGPITIVWEPKWPLVTLFSPLKQVKAVYYNDTPMANMPLYLFKGQSWSKELFQNVTTNDEGIAEFTLCTTDEEGTINLEVWEKTKAYNLHMCHSVVPSWNIWLMHWVFFSINAGVHFANKGIPKIQNTQDRKWRALAVFSPRAIHRNQDEKQPWGG